MSSLVFLFILVVFTLDLLEGSPPKHGYQYKVKSLDQCISHDFSPIGCMKQSDHDRKKSDLILTGRDPHSPSYNDKEHAHVNDGLWTDYDEWLPNFICQCANELYQKYPNSQSHIIGIGYYAECWSISKQNFERLLKEKGVKAFSHQCVKTDFKKFFPLRPKIEKCGSFSGKDDTMFVYKVAKQQDSCKQFYVQKGCKKIENDTTGKSPKPKGLQKVIVLDKNDKKLFCTCSKEAIKSGHRYFSVNRQGKCFLWDSSVMELEPSEKCYDSASKQCPKYRSSCKSSPHCSGLTSLDHQIYEAVQGPFACEKNP
ncbi:uncharacterized protein [Clytia hemisphaerica]